MKVRLKPKTSDLFIELAKVDLRDTALYSIKSEDCYDQGQVYPSLHKLYVDFGDPTEYYFANQYCLNLAHWREVYSHPLILPYVERWREELELKIKADALRSIVAASKGENKDAIQAARYLLQQEWFKHGNVAQNGRGRPKTKSAAQDAPLRDEKTVSEDFKRILNPAVLSVASPSTRN